MAVIPCNAIVLGDLLCSHPSRELSPPAVALVTFPEGDAWCSCHGPRVGQLSDDGGTIWRLTFPCSTIEPVCRCGGPYPCQVHPLPYAGSQGPRGRRPTQGLA